MSKIKLPSLASFQDRLKSLKEKNNLKQSSYTNLNFRLNKPEENGGIATAKVRFLPNPHNGFDPFVETWQHYSIGSFGTIPCAKQNFGESCALCDQVKEIYDYSNSLAVSLGINPKEYNDMTANAEIKGLFKKARDLKAKKRIYVTLIDRSHEQEGVKFWGINEKFFDGLLREITDTISEYPDKNPIDHLSGIDVKVTLTNNGSEYGTTSFSLLSAANPTKALPNKTDEEIEAFINGIVNIWGTICQKKSSEEIANIVEQLIGTDGLIDTSRASNNASQTPARAISPAAQAFVKATSPKQNVAQTTTVAVDEALNSIDIDQMSEEI